MTIGPAGVDLRLPWGVRHQAFADMTALHDRQADQSHSGASLLFTFNHGPSVYLGGVNSGVSNADLRAVRRALADRTGLTSRP